MASTSTRRRKAGKKNGQEITRRRQTHEAPKLEKLLELRRSIAEQRPEFVRPESWRYVRLHPEWRKPKGMDNKVRKSIKG